MASANASDRRVTIRRVQRERRARARPPSRAPDRRQFTIRRRIRPVEHAPEDLRRVLAVERQATDHGFVEEHTEGEHVGARPDVAPLDLLGSHVRGRAEHLARGRDALRVEQLRDAEVGQLDARPLPLAIARGRPDDAPERSMRTFSGLTSRMNDPLLVRVRKRGRYLESDRGGQLRRQSLRCRLSSDRSVVPRTSSTTR